MDSLLRIEELTKRFPQTLANDGISLDIRRGEIHCLLGENGAGKTTLAECIYGYYKPDSGRMYFADKLVSLSSPSDAIHLGIGMVHQHFVLVPPFSVVENVVVGTPSKGILLDLMSAEQKLKTLCENYGVNLDLQAKIWQLSMGEQQWVEILKALYMGCELLVLDEPTAVLTPQETERLFGVLRRMTEEGLSVIFITHKLDEVMELSDRVTVLRKGKLVDTVNTSDVTKADLARMMVGREVIFRIEKEQVARGEPVLEVRDLRANNDRGREALGGISFTLHRNEILGLAGIAGNGQKELFEVLAGLRHAEQGQILLDGEEITNCSPREAMSRGLGFVPEDRIHEGLITEFSVAENLILGQQRSRAYLRGPLLDSKQINQFASACVETFAIATPSLGHPAKFLSGGNLQKIILARELGQNPICLLAHQPTRGLDVGVIEYVRTRLLEKCGEGAGILLASEDLEEIFNLSDRIAVIFKGQIMDILEPDQFDREVIGLMMAGTKEKAQ